MLKLAENERPVVEDRSDADLLRLFVAARDEAAFAALVRRHGPLVAAVTGAVLRNNADAEDAFQAVFLLLARRADSLRRPGALPAWLHRTALRVAVRALRNRRRQPPPCEVDPDALPASTRPPLATRQLAWALHEELARLPSPYRTVLVLCYFAGATHAEAAEQLGLSVEALKGRLRRARSQLARRLAVGGASLAAFALLLDRAAVAAAAGTAPRLVQDATAAVASLGPRWPIATSTSTAAAKPALTLAQGTAAAMLWSTTMKTLTWTAWTAGLLVASTWAVAADQPPNSKVTASENSILTASSAQPAAQASATNLVSPQLESQSVQITAKAPGVESALVQFDANNGVLTAERVELLKSLNDAEDKFQVQLADGHAALQERHEADAARLAEQYYEKKLQLIQQYYDYKLRLEEEAMQNEVKTLKGRLQQGGDSYLEQWIKEPEAKRPTAAMPQIAQQQSSSVAAQRELIAEIRNLRSEIAELHAENCGVEEATSRSAADLNWIRR